MIGLLAARRCLISCLRHLWVGAQVMGGLHLCATEGRAAPPRSHGAGPAGPMPGHPERLRPDLPLSELELWLSREFAGTHEAWQPPGYRRPPF
ncbi:DUF6059 family protein [Kitasatospora sp. NPDC050543]|uniref:DUF6059 family protein n=1 Tax=Kitasatospora sp. NPDC050543 TaxID=3364054 RepID=UPI0037AB0501